MEVDLDPSLRALYTDPAAPAPCEAAVVRRFRFLVGLFLAAVSEADVTAFPRFRLHPVDGAPHARGNRYAVRLTPEWQLLVELRGTGPQKVIGVLALTATDPATPGLATIGTTTISTTVTTTDPRRGGAHGGARA